MRSTPPRVRSTYPPARAAAPVRTGAARHRQPRSAASSWPFAVAVGVVALLLRAAGLTRANDLFIDELTYAGFARDVAAGDLPRAAGEPFFLHPPGSFLLDALAIRALGLGGDAMDLALALRGVNVLVGAVGVVLAFLIAHRLSGLVGAVVVAVVLVSDPFVLRYDTRLMIETPAMTAVLAGLLLVLIAIGQPPSRRRTGTELAAGLALGVALMCKDMTAVVAIVPLLVATRWRRTVAARSVARIVAAAALPYLLYLGVIGFAGLLPRWWDAKVGGLLRMVGLEQTTGFNAAPGANLVERLIELLTRFGTSYLLLGLCVFAGLAAAAGPVPARRLIGIVAACTGTLGLYAVFGGAAEEQFGYYVVVSSVLAVAATGAEVIERRPALAGVLTAVTAVFVFTGLVLGVHARFVVDDGYAAARGWLQGNVPAGENVGLTTVTAEFALLPHPNRGVWPSLSSLGSADADLVLTQSHPLREGYGYAAPPLLDWLAAHARPAFVFTGPSNGETVIWRLDRAAVDDAVARGASVPPVTGGFR